MSRAPQVVLDASAILALLREERGAERIREVLPRSVVSAVNLAEVLSKLADEGDTDLDASAHELGELFDAITPFTIADAVATARLRLPTKRRGLSLGDRACLALAQRLGVPVLTTDRAWADAKLQEIEVELVR